MSFTEDLFNAYYDARKNKRGKIDQIDFEMNYEKKIIQVKR